MSNHEITCHTCVGACCQDSYLILSATEAVYLQERGTKFFPVLKAFLHTELTDDEIANGETNSWGSPQAIQQLEQRVEEAESEMLRSMWQSAVLSARSMKPGEGLYLVLGRCGLLNEQNQCSDYEHRPQICRDFKEGGSVCIGFRQRENVPTPVVLAPRPTA